MSGTVLRFLGGFDVFVDDRPVTKFATDKARALLAYLALEAARPHTRSVLASLFWPDIHEHHARVNLRNTIYRLRKTLDAVTPGLSEQLLNVTRQSIQFNSGNAFVDVQAFQANLDAVSSHVHTSLACCPSCLNHLAAAADRYHGELLDGLSIADSAPFEEWLLLRRELVAHQVLKMLADLSRALEKNGKIDESHKYAMQSLTMDPYREETHRQIMRLRARQGMPEQALVQYETLRRLLQAELSVEPDPETTELARQISSGDLSTEMEVQPVDVDHVHDEPMQTSLPLRADWSETPRVHQFYGRAEELSQLEQWLVQDGCRMVAILGIGGMGKTTLAAQVVHNIADQFDTIIWRSLLNAPKLDEILPSILQILSNQQLSELSASLDEQLALLSVLLRQNKVLLVLDNLESVLDELRAGSFYEEYRAYEQLMRLFATRDHQGHLLLTSRERPQGYIRWERDAFVVKSMRIGGLDKQAGKTLLQQRGVVGQLEEEESLVERYSGNPLALKLVADTVHEIFDGDVAEFLTDETLVFDDVRTVLDQQFQRLSPLEQEILYWMAVEREAVAVSTLRSDLLHPPSVRDLLEALRALQRRSLIEKQEGGFGLQNVVIEYLTARLIQSVVQEFEDGEFDLFHRIALLKAQSKEYIRISQARLLLEPIGQRLFARFGRPTANEGVADPFLDNLRTRPYLASGYAGGNSINLMLHFDINVANADFSKLGIRQAYLQGIRMPGVKFVEADLTNTVFNDDFSSIFSVDISPDGGLLAAGSDNGEIWLWQMPSRKPMSVLRGHVNRVLSVVFCPASQYLATAGMDQKIRLWDVESEKLKHVLEGHVGGVRALAFSPDGTILASVSQDQSVRLWSVRHGTLLATLSEHSDWVNGVAFHPDGTLLATTGHDRTICLWSVSEILDTSSDVPPESTRGLLDVLHGHNDTVVVVAFSPDGKILASTGAEGVVLLWDLETKQVRKTLYGHSQWVRGLAFNTSGTVLASGDVDGVVRLWELPDGRGMNTLTNSDEVWSLIMSPDESTLICGGLDGSIHLWDLRAQWRGRAVSTLKGYVAPIGTIAFDPSGEVLATADERQQRVRLWHVDVEHLEAEQTGLLEDHNGLIRAVAFNLVGDKLVSVCEDAIVRIWDASTGQLLDRLHGHTSGLHCVSFNIDGTTLATAGDDGTIHLWHIDGQGKGQMVNVLQGHTGTVHKLIFSPAGGLLASVSADRTIRFWHPHTGRCLQVLDEYSQDSWSIAFCPDGVTLASGGRDSLIRLWDVRDLPNIRSRESLSGHDGNVLDLTFSPRGSILASASEDGTVRIWDVPAHKHVHTLRGGGQSIMSLAFRPDGHVLASGGFDGIVRLWDPSSGELLRNIQPPGFYQGMNITGAIGITETQRRALISLGAIDEDSIDQSLSQRRNPTTPPIDTVAATEFSQSDRNQ